VQTIELPNVEGYFDHMAVDVKDQRPSSFLARISAPSRSSIFVLEK